MIFSYFFFQQTKALALGSFVVFPRWKFPVTYDNGSLLLNRRSLRLFLLLPLALLVKKQTRERVNVRYTESSTEKKAKGPEDKYTR